MDSLDAVRCELRQHSNWCTILVKKIIKIIRVADSIAYFAVRHAARGQRASNMMKLTKLAVIPTRMAAFAG